MAPVATVVASPSSGDLMQRWRGYALTRITPRFDWAEAPAARQQAPTVLDRIEGPSSSMIVPLDGDGRLALTVSLQSLAGSSALGPDAGETTPLLTTLGSPLESSTASTGLSQKFGDSGRVDFSVVLAHQRFAAASLDGYDYSALSRQPGALAFSESSHGTGLELDLRDGLLPSLDWYAGYRSRINMDSFQNLRGIYGTPGDLDIPARMQAGLAWQTLPRTQVRLGVERIKYSSIQPFVSSALPRRLLAVLGDGTSPEFSWRDLDVYSMTVAHDFDTTNHVSVRYSTGEQPEPTSPLLSKLLMSDAANYSVGLSFMHETQAMQWRLMANYAPTEFVLGIPTSARSNQPRDARQLEFESTWAWRF